MNAPKIGTTLLFFLISFVTPLFAQELDSGANTPVAIKMAYFSPNLDGVQDTLQLPLHISDERYITSYNLMIRDVNGTTVRSIKNKETRPETADFGNLIQRFFRLKEGLKIPKLLIWDGRSDDGSLVPDGTYTYQLEVADDNNNVSKTDSRPVIVDTKLPILSIDAPQTAFAPGGDRPKLAINQSCDQSLSPVEKWDAGIFDTKGRLIRSWTYRNSLPAQTNWDGKNNHGVLAPDGIYTFRLTTSDRAGNRAAAEIVNLLLLNQPTPLIMNIDNASFSPNDDGIKDTVMLSINGNDQVKVVNWVANLIDTAGIVVRTYRGVDSLPSILPIDGMNQDHQHLPEGNYKINLTVFYVNGNKPSADSPGIKLDLSKPVVSVSCNERVFSPNGDGNKDSVSISQSASQEPVWEAHIFRSDDLSGQAVRSWTWRHQPDPMLRWDGRDDSGIVVADGGYSYQIQATDLAGNTGFSSLLVIRVDNRLSAVSIRPMRNAFSPGTDSSFKSMDFGLGQLLADGVESWRLDIMLATDDSAEILKTWQGSGIPASPFRWDGTLIDGTPASDGKYFAKYSLLYQKGDQPVSWSTIFTLDTKKPEARVSTENPYFSPDGDGKQDVLIIKQQTSVEDNWRGTISDSRNQVVKNYNWADNAPPILRWDGTDNAGNLVPDGEYHYDLKSEDAAGNAGATQLSGIKLSTFKPELVLNISYSAFSPNGDSKHDALEFIPDLKVGSDVKSWKLLIKPIKGGGARSVFGTESLPTKLFWDGKTDGGRLAPEGDYIAQLTVMYKGGQSSTAVSPKFSLDSTPPTATVFADPTLFSPNGDGLKDVTLISQDVSKEENWTGIFRMAEPQNADIDPVVRKIVWTGWPPKKFEWDGTNNQGSPVPDGRYLYQVSAQDAAGNFGISAPIEIRVDNRVTSLSVKPTLRWYRSGVVRSSVKQQFELGLGLNEGVESWALEIHSSDGTLVKNFKGSSNPPPTIDWDGKTNSGQFALDGDYYGLFVVNYLKGDRPQLRSDLFSIDTKAPEISVSANDTLFSPDGDGFKDVVSINQDSSSENLWEGGIYDATGNKLRSYFWKTKAIPFTWDGRDDNGNRMPDGVYRYEINATDQAGNTARAEIKSIIIDNRPTALLLTANSKGFAPGIVLTTFSTIDFKPIVGLADGITAWNLKLTNLDLGKIIERTISGSGFPPADIVWDGKKDDHSLAPEGHYDAVLTLEYIKGNQPVAHAPGFVLDRSGPEIQVSVAPRPFSPDDDGEDDEVTFTIGIGDLSPIKNWNLEIKDPQGNHFVSFAGQGTSSSRISWNGQGDTSELVQSAMDYSLVMTVTDALENTSIVRDTIPVDILVLRDGDLLRIRIPGINFPANSPDLGSDRLGSDKLAFNVKTLDRLAEILRKYASYQVRIEGHANITQYQDTKLAEQENDNELIPLSEKRANAVRDALIRRGIAPLRMTTIGVGGSRPLVPNNDATNVWKNRRIEFILNK